MRKDEAKDWIGEQVKQYIEDPEVPAQYRFAALNLMAQIFGLNPKSVRPPTPDPDVLRQMRQKKYKDKLKAKSLEEKQEAMRTRVNKILEEHPDPNEPTETEEQQPE